MAFNAMPFVMRDSVTGDVMAVTDTFVARSAGDGSWDFKALPPRADELREDWRRIDSSEADSLLQEAAAAFESTPSSDKRVLKAAS